MEKSTAERLLYLVIIKDNTPNICLHFSFLYKTTRIITCFFIRNYS